MDFLLSLWLPILLSAAAVGIVSTIFGMPFLHHKNDWIGLPTAPHGGSEDAFMEYLRTSGIKPGNYLFPDFRTREAMESEKVCKALKEGPVGHLSLWQPPLSMGGKLAATFIVYLVVSTLIAYLASVTLPKTAGGEGGFAKVFQVVGTAGILAYSFSFIPSAIWFGAYKRTIVAGIIDGIVYGVITGAIFAWRWPA